MSCIVWKKATKKCRPINCQDKDLQNFLCQKTDSDIHLRQFKYAEWYKILVITKEGKFYTDLYFESGKFYTDFKQNDREYNLDVMHVSNDEGYFKIPWIKIDKWIYMDELIESTMENK